VLVIDSVLYVDFIYTLNYLTCTQQNLNLYMNWCLLKGITQWWTLVELCHKNLWGLKFTCSIYMVRPFSTELFSLQVLGLFVNLISYVSRRIVWVKLKIYPSVGLRNLTPVPCFFYATCVSVNFRLSMFLLSNRLQNFQVRVK